LEKIGKLVGIVFVLLFSTAFQNQSSDVKKIINFLNNLNTLTSEFIQIDTRGDIVEGIIYLNKPSKFRIEYRPPSNVLIVCDGTKITMYNKKLKNVSTYSVSETPLNFFLTENITSDKFEIVDFQKKENAYTIQIVSKLKKNLERVKLVFEQNPFQLKKWVLYTPNGNVTSVTLENLIINPPLNNKIFKVIDPTKKIFIEKFLK
tara:strand:- start:229 stop:840 length:612 start_codon:yes stop_codon:yes gene_type:complete